MRTHDNGIDRDMTSQEIADHQHLMAIYETEKAEKEAAAAQKAAIRKALADKLGVTVEELAAAFG